MKTILFYTFLIILASGCKTYDYSIEVNDNMMTYIDGGHFEQQLTPYISDLENPKVTGWFSLNHPLQLDEEWVPLPPPNSGTKRLKVNAYRSDRNDKIEIVTTPNASRSQHMDVKITGRDRRNNKYYYRYEAPFVALPENGDAINLVLKVNNSNMLSCDVKLNPNVIVIPVRVHVFKNSNGGSNNSRYINYSTEQIRGWFDQPSFSTNVRVVTDPVGTTRYVSINHDNNYDFKALDTIWAKAGIQFKLDEVNFIQQNQDLDIALLLPGFRDTTYGFVTHENCELCGDQHRRLFPFHVTERNRAGGNLFHIYIGGSVNEPCTESAFLNQRIAVACMPFPRCTDPSQNDARINYALFSWGSLTYRQTLAHELGHLLGLDHPVSVPGRACGCNLIEDCDNNRQNLMESNILLDAYNLTERQIEQARSIACKYLCLWGRTNPNCTCN